MSADKPDPGSDDAAKIVDAASKIARIDAESRDIIKGGFADLDPELIATFNQVERKPKDFLNLPGPLKLFWLIEFMKDTAIENHQKVINEGAEEQDIRISGETIDRTISRSEILKKFLDLNDPTQTVGDIADKVRYEITKLEYTGTPKAMQSHFEHIQFLQFILNYTNSREIDKYYVTHPSFKEYLERNW